ncbi:hypothetical protein DPMN_108524 [Dreissena polymorpha]|uniref:Uncharacterized protein n=1 Tax=Dreissena polymorpha TaxID=45954 RepID=A0A9D4K8N9_DREPO|nr:hypothetical protein DPMN_108524 [Dreissena polymorpha]
MGTTFYKFESYRVHKDIVGTTVVGTQDLGSAESRSWKKADNRTRREMVQAEVRLAEEKDRGIRAVAMGCQGAWTKWQTT